MEAPVNENFVVIRDDLNEEPTDHPSRKSIVEFLKSILVDSFHTSFPGKGEALIDVLLETTPDTASKKEQNQFVTELLKATMDHLLAGDVLLCGMSASLPLTSNTTGASYATLATNVFYFASRLVDCVWNGQYTEDAANVMEFLIKLHSQAKRKSGIPLDALMHSINRIVLFLLSRSAQSVQLQATMMDSLNKVISNRAVIFCPANTDSEFFGCLAHLLFMLSVKPDCQASNDMEERQFENGSTQLAVAARRVWEELYMAKKATLEEKFKTVLVPEKSMRAKVAISRDSRIFYEKMKERRPRTIDPRIFDQSTMINTPSEEKVFLFRDMQEINASMIRRASLKPPVKKDSPVEEDEDVEDEERMVDIDGTSIERSGSEKSRRSAASTGVQSPSAVSPPPVTNAEEQAEAEDKFEVAGKEVAKLPPQAPIPKGPDNQTLLRLLEEGEELHSMFRCARIQGLDTCEGLLLFGKEHYYVVDGFTLLKTREIRDLDFLPEDLHDPIVPYTATGSVRPSSSKRTCSKFSYDDIREVHKRRYLLQPIALEVFSADGRNYLLAFPKKMRNRVHTKFLSVAKDLTDGGAQSVSGQRSSMSVEQSGRASSLFSSLIGESSVTQRWVRGEISNFQYLMFLNTLAGRTFNDLSQYPIFPWILRDYDSEVLDLTDPNAFRDLSKPMGAQTPDRLEQFLKRYREWDDPTGETPPYMYGTHYSSAMIIVSYLVRLEPFTQQFLKLQGGHFDLADRMFHSVGDAWMSASKNNMADVKELIPEFFYLPEMFANANNFDLGVKQNGIALDDVILPPWAKGDPREFIRVHREALESDYVSAHLHDWIDLIFGAKQQGQGAIDGQNLYHHLFYEGNVDFEAIEDPLTRNATIGFINNFGQIPTQLFRKPHPQKKLSPASSLSRAAVGLTTSPDSWTSTPGVTTERLFFHAIDCLKPPAQPVKELKGGVGQILQNEKGQLCAVEQNKVLLPPNFTRYLSWGFADRSIRLGNYETDKSSCVHELTDCGEIVCGVCPNSRTLITGSTNTVVNVWELCGATGRSNGPSRLRLRKALYGHTESVTCLASSSSYGLVVSGSRDATCIVWDLSGLSLIRQLRPHSGPVSAVVINEATGDMASASGTNLFVWSINGQLLSMVNTATTSAIDNRQLILTIGFSTLNEWDSQHVIFTGSNDGVVRLWSLEFVQVATAETQPAADASNAPLSDVDKDQATSSCHAAVSTNSKGLRQFCPEILQERLTRQKRKLIASCGSSLDTPSGETPRNWSLSGSPEPSSPFLQDADSGFATPICNRSLSFGSANAMPGGAMQRQCSTDSLVNVSARTCPRLKPGFHWQRQLVYRFKLTMHTAFDRKDNAAPAPISAVAASRDHKTLFVGDSRGRVWPWVLGDVSSGRADHWVQDPSKNNCTQCHQRFTLAERKHHCRNCGQIFCARCSRFESEIKHMKITKPVRVCQSCFLRLKAETM
uniref:WD repeat and FYVE domain-containing protein 3 n=1 Tax=Plectus sambesii TaxID=2011161 RepID=A0A914V9C1_9BILA